MRTDDLKAWLSDQPFKPFLVHLSNGTTVPVKHPELAIATRTVLQINSTRPGDTDDHETHCALIHINHITPLDSALPGTTP